MALPLPELSLSHGQLLWALSLGKEPDRILKAQVRYLRLLGIPATGHDAAPGSGNALRYDFYDLVDLGVAVRALHLRCRPKDIAAVLVNNRDDFHRQVTEVWKEYPEGILSQSWVRRGLQFAPIFENFAFVRIHDRRSEKWGELDFAWSGDEHLQTDLLDPIERFDDGESRALIPLTKLMAPWVAHALDAPELRRGPK